MGNVLLFGALELSAVTDCSNSTSATRIVNICALAWCKKCSHPVNDEQGTVQENLCQNSGKTLTGKTKQE